MVILIFLSKVYYKNVQLSTPQIFPLQPYSIRNSIVTEKYLHDFQLYVKPNNTIQTDFSHYKNTELDSLGKNLRYYRLFNKIKQKDMAIKLEINKSTLVDYENDKVLPSNKLLKQYALICGLNQYYFFDKCTFGNFFWFREFCKIVIEKICEEYDLNQVQLSKMCNVSKTTIGYWKKEKSNPSLQNWITFKSIVKTDDLDRIFNDIKKRL